MEYIYEQQNTYLTDLLNSLSLEFLNNIIDDIPNVTIGIEVHIINNLIIWPLKLFKFVFNFLSLKIIEKPPSVYFSTFFSNSI